MMMRVRDEDVTELTDEMLYRRVLASKENHQRIKMINTELEKLKLAGNAKLKDEIEHLLVYPQAEQPLPYPAYFKIINSYTGFLIAISRCHPKSEPEDYLHRAVNHVIQVLEEMMVTERESIKALKIAWRIEYENIK